MLKNRENQRNGVSIICEIASAHGGNVDILKKLLVAADNANSDWVKIQIFQFDSLIADENDQFSALKQIELSSSEWMDVMYFSREIKPKLIVEVFDFPSLQLVKDESIVKAFKIPTADLSDRAFVDAVCRIGKPVFIGVGGATINEIDDIFEQASAYDVTITLLHGIQNFPTLLEDSLLEKIQLLRQRYKCDVGFADHVDAEDIEMARTLPAMAVASGASVIEKHITIDRSEKGFDYYSSLNPDEFKEFVKHIRHISMAIGSINLDILTNAEKNYRNKMKKFAVLVNDVEKGTMVKDVVVQYRRTSSPGITRKEFEEFNNKIFRSNLAKGIIVNEQHFR